MGSPALSSSFSVGTASRLLVPGEMLTPWNDRAAPGASSSSVKPPYPFPPSLLPTLSHQVYNLRCKPVFGLVLARLQATLGPWWGSALPAAVDPPTLGKASISLPTLCPLSSPAQHPAWGFPLPPASAWQSPQSLAADCNTLPRLEDHHQHPLLHLFNNDQILLYMASQLPNVCCPHPSLPR